MKQKERSQDEIVEQVQKLLEERGRKALEMARKEILEEEIGCKEVREALNYFMNEYWHDLTRPALLSLCCEAVGGDPEATIPVAIPLSLISGGIDIHDDIIDHSETKRSRRTVLGKFGKDIAVLAGDALIFKGLALLHGAAEKGVPAEEISVINDIIERMFFELGDAEALELRLRGRLDVTPEEYMHVVKKKGADVEAHTRISAILGGGREKEVEALGRYGRLLGMIFIIGDDVMDTSDMKELQHRIRIEHLPLPIVYALQNPMARLKIASILSKEKMTKQGMETILKVTEIDQSFRKLFSTLVQDALFQASQVRKNTETLRKLILSAALLA